MRLRRLAPLLSLCCVTFLIWCAATNRWTPAAWQTPLQLHGDPLEIYARIQLAAEDLTQPLLGYADLPRLAAPLGGDWRAYPISDRLVFTLLGAFARVFGLFLAINLALAFVHVLNAASFFLCARFLRWRLEWAFATALLFAFANYNFRWGITFSFSLSFAIPPLLLLCAWIARGAPVARPRPWLIAAATLGAWFATANPYLTFFAAQLVLLSAALQLLRQRQLPRLHAAGLFFTALIIGFVLHYAPYLFSAHDSSVSFARSYAASEIYALKPADLVIPPSEHRFAPFAHLGQSYLAQSPLRGEFFINYLGVFGILGLAILLWSAVRALARPRRFRFPDASAAVAWTLLFSAVGGLNSLLALGGFDLFRASNRNSVFLLVWALWFFGRFAQRHTRAFPFLARTALALLIAAIGVLDSLPQLPARSLLRANADTLRQTSQLTSVLEQQLGPHALIFQIPSPPFPEAGRIGQMEDYAQFLPFLTSSTLRLSYGALRDTPAATYLDALARAPAPLLHSTLEQLGFRALWIDRRAQPDGYSHLIDTLRNAGAPEIAQPVHPHVTVFALNPVSHPAPPDFADARILPAWNPDAPAGPIRVAAIDGWHGLEHDSSTTWRWAQHGATAAFVLDDTATVRLSFAAFSGSPGQLVLHVDGREVWRNPVSWQTRERHTLSLPLPPGSHRLVWTFDGSIQRASAGDARQIGFAIANLEATPIQSSP